MGECCQKYGFPIYGAAWVPTKNLLLDDEDKQDLNSWLVLCGGGGAGHSGLPNCFVVTQFDSSSNSLPPNPVSRLGTDGDLPYRMAVHPGGEGVICSFPESTRWFEWDVSKSTGVPKLVLKSSEKQLTELENTVQQLTLTFSSDGAALAVGDEDGHLRVFKWPSMELLFDQIDENSRIKDLTFSSDGKFLVSLGSRGPGRVWDVSSLKIIASLPKEKDENLGFCRFSHTKTNTQILYVIAMKDKGGNIICWDTTSWKRIRSKKIVRDPISAFNVSADGEFLAVGTIQGDIHILNSDLRVHQVIKEAHMGLVTVLTFSEDSRSLFSVSMDSSARVTLIKNKKKQSGLSIWVILLVVLLAILAYFLKNKGVF